MSDTQKEQDIAAIARQERNEKLIEGHAATLISFFVNNVRDKFKLAHNYLMQKGMPKYAARILFKSRAVLGFYFKSKEGLAALEKLLSDNSKAVVEPQYHILNSNDNKEVMREQLIINEKKGILQTAISNDLVVLSNFLLSSINESDVHVINGIKGEKGSPLLEAINRGYEGLSCK